MEATKRPGQPGWAGRGAVGPDPSKVGPYRVLRPLGEGGLGRAYLARSSGGRQVAVKLLRPELAADAAYRARFATEAAAARTVAGRYIAPVVDADPHAARPWIATAFVAGPTLEHRIRRSGLMDERRLRELGAAMAEALLAIHRAGVVHGALKPSNVLMSVDGPRIVDFGISRGAGGGPAGGSAGGAPADASGYAAPEQQAGSGEPSRPGDVFSLGAVLAFAALGRGPFGTGDARALRYRVAHDEPDLTGVPAHIRTLIAACLARNPHARPSVAEALTALARTEPNAADAPTVSPDGVTVTVPVDGSTRPPGPQRLQGLPGLQGLRPPQRRGVLKAAGIAAAAVTAVAGGLSLLETFGIFTDGHQNVPASGASGASADDAVVVGTPKGFAAAPAPLWRSAPTASGAGGGLQLLGSTLIRLTTSAAGVSSVLALEAASGKSAWPASATSAVTDARGGKWYGVFGPRLYGVAPAPSGPGASASELHGLDSQGTVMIRLRLNAQVNDILCVSQNTLIATTGTNTSILTAFDLRTGRAIWTGSDPSGRASNAAADATRCYLFGSSTVYALDVATGKTLWKASGALDSTAADLWSTANAVIVAGSGGTAGTVGLDPSTGRILWRSNEYRPVATTGSVIYAVGMGSNTSTNTRAIAALDAQDGRTLWTFHSPVQPATTLVPLAADGTGAGGWGSDRVLVLPYQSSSTAVGGFLALDGATGKPLWAYSGTLGGAGNGGAGNGGAGNGGAAGGSASAGWPVTVSGNTVYAASATTLYAFKAA